MSSNRPAADVVVDVAMVRRLLESQHPDLVHLPIVELANGWDNVMFRLGDELLVRVPRREMAGRLVANEVAALPVLAPHLPLPVPTPVRVGQPDDEYPYVWAVLPWLEGRPVGTDAPSDAEGAAQQLGEFLQALHVGAPVDAPVNPYRGHFIGENDDRLRERLDGGAQTIETFTDFTVATLLSRWVELIDVAPRPGPPVWLHGDLHPLNVLTDGISISAVIDWGDVTSGDPAVDLAVAWGLFEPAERSMIRTLTGADDATWQRAEAWALYFAAMYLLSSDDDPALRAVSLRLFDRLTAD